MQAMWHLVETCRGGADFLQISQSRACELYFLWKRENEKAVWIVYLVQSQEQPELLERYVEFHQWEGAPYEGNQVREKRSRYKVDLSHVSYFQQIEDAETHHWWRQASILTDIWSTVFQCQWRQVGTGGKYLWCTIFWKGVSFFLWSNLAQSSPKIHPRKFGIFHCFSEIPDGRNHVIKLLGEVSQLYWR